MAKFKHTVKYDRYPKGYPGPLMQFLYVDNAFKYNVHFKLRHNKRGMWLMFDNKADSIKFKEFMSDFTKRNTLSA